jgi:hypothetical protein
MKQYLRFKNKIRLLPTLLGIAIVLFPALSSSDDKMVTVMKDLDFSKLHFVVYAQPEFRAILQARGREKLKQAGIYKGESTRPSNMSLVLNLRTYPTDEMPEMGKGCAGKVIFQPHITFMEPVIIPRNQLQIEWTNTWGVEQAAVVRDPVPIEELERTLDEYLDQFIMAYKMGNPGKKQPPVN